MHNVNYTRELHLGFDWNSQDDTYYESEWTITAIERLEDLTNALRLTIKNNNPKIFLKACEAASAIAKNLNNGGFNRTMAKLKAHYKNEIKLDDQSLRRNILRLQAIDTMLIDSLAGNGMVPQVFHNSLTEDPVE